MNKLEGHSVDYELLGKYLAGECNTRELAEVEEWLRTPENASELETLRQFWEASEVEPALVDTDRAWDQVKGRIKPLDATPAPAIPRRRTPFWWAAAAVLVMAVGLGWYLTRSDAPVEVNYTTFANADSSPQTVQLPDGSVVTLNSGAEIRFAEGFSEPLREVQLEGEAFFDVTKNPAKPFVVRAGGAEVRVLGTSFNVSTEQGLAVKVTEGKVKLSAPPSEAAAAESVVLEAGMEGRYDEERAEIVEVGEMEANELYWKTQRLEFKASPLTDVRLELEALFGVEIELENENIARCKLTTNFFQDDIESILQVISESFDLTVTKDGNKFTLSGEGC